MDARAEWIQQKISILIKDGTAKDEKEAYAIAVSMWEKEHDLSEIAILTTGKTKNGYAITDKIYSEVKDNYDPKKIHKAPIVIGPHEDPNLEPVAWINSLGEKKINSRDWITASNIEYVKGGEEKLREALKTYKFNSPELSPLEPEWYDPDKTKDFPKGAEGDYYLRRVNIVPLPAQFGMPEAKLAELDFRFIRLSELSLCEPYYSKSAWCQECGRTFADSEMYCSTDGSELKHAQKEITAMAEKKEDPKPPEVKEPEAKLSEKADSKDVLALSEQVKSLVLQLQERTAGEKELKVKLAELESKEKEKDVQHEVERMVEKGETKACCYARGVRLLQLAENIKEPIKLADADGKIVDESVADAIRFVLRNGGGMTAGELKVVAKKPDTGKSFDELRMVKIEETAAKLKIDTATSAGMQRAIALAEKDHPEIRIQSTAGGDN